MDRPLLGKHFKAQYKSEWNLTFADLLAAALLRRVARHALARQRRSVVLLSV
jgi:hypothetical protein